MAHVSGRQKNRVHLVNPNGVNLKDYEERLEKALDKYRRRLDKLVWDALPDEDKQEFESDEPVPFSEHRSKLLQLLSKADWPVAESDIICLEQEIEKGEKFLQQSKDLRRAAAEAASDNLSESIDSHASSPRSGRRSQSIDQVVQVDDNKLITTSSTPRSASTKTPRQSNATTPRPPSEDKNTSRHHQHNRRVVSSGAKSYLVPRRGHVKVSTLRGTRVIARNDEDGMYYPGKVLKCPNIKLSQFTGLKITFKDSLRIKVSLKVTIKVTIKVKLSFKISKSKP
nr:hypothetical protein BaRGS_008736 [Batillaria attramentaria]